MLGIFILGMILFYILMAYFIWNSDGVSCVDEKKMTQADGGEDGSEGGSDSGEDYYCDQS